MRDRFHHIGCAFNPLSAYLSIFGHDNLPWLCNVSAYTNISIIKHQENPIRLVFTQHFFTLLENSDVFDYLWSSAFPVKRVIIVVFGAKTLIYL